MAFITELWTDGACSGNPGPGGWAYILIARRLDGTVAKKLDGHGGEHRTTNNRMELKAALAPIGSGRGGGTAVTSKFYEPRDNLVSSDRAIMARASTVRSPASVLRR